MNLVVGEGGPVDVDNPPCGNCRHRTMQGLCRRLPPVFIPPFAVQQPNGQMALTAPQWAFPPAMVKCGEHKPPDIE